MANPFRTSNPVLKEKAFTGEIVAGQAMTIQGTVNKTGLLLLFAVVAAAWTWGLAHSETPEATLPWMMGGLIAALVTIFKKEWSAISAPLYAIFEGLALGGISAMFELRYPGIAIQAVGLTFATLFVMLMAYKTGLIRATRGFTLGLLVATGSVALVYIVDIVLRSFFHTQVPYLNSNGPIGIGISLVIVVIAALNFILDFAVIENGAKMGAPKYMEWYGAFGLMVTLVWLYLEMLRLLSKVRSR